ncbi:DNA (cytosine-5-)-methyltransferase [Veillonella dispar]|nr:DNA (cytosine-5-)-methyltransferase [Veillonella dispar]
MNKYKVMDLFSGAGGFLLGFEKEGFDIILSTDFDEDCEKVHKINRPNIPFVRADIRTLSNEKIDELLNGQTVDVLIGGPPCQGFSTIGNRVSSDPERRTKYDPRNDLFREYIRILNHLQPKVFVMENVKGIKTRDGGTIFEEIQRQFKETGYDFNCITLNAADYGVPQYRERVFFYGTRIGVDFEVPIPTHGENRNPYNIVLDAIGDLANKGEEVSNHVPLKHGEKNIRRYQLIPEGGRLPENDLPADLYRKNFGNTFKRLDRNKPSLTMVPGHNAFPIHPWLDRSLTVREAARIQTFPDDYIFSGRRDKQCMQVGNAVPVQLANAWAKQVKGVLDNYEKE